MPSSFSRFLSDEELERVRELYFESLKDEEKPEEGPAKDPLDRKPPGSAEAAPTRVEEST